MENKNTLFPKGDAAPVDYFTGITWVNTLVPKDTTLNTVVASVVFEPGSRNNWHTHPGRANTACDGRHGLLPGKRKADTGNLQRRCYHYSTRLIALARRLG